MRKLRIVAAKKGKNSQLTFWREKQMVRVADTDRQIWTSSRVMVEASGYTYFMTQNRRGPDGHLRRQPAVRRE